MKALRRTALILGLFAAAGCSESSQKINFAPDFSLSSIEKSAPAVTLSALHQNTPVLLVFWASWCPSCVDEIPHLNELFEKYPKEKLQILSINVQEPAKHVREFVKKQGLKYPVLLDEEGEVATQYGLVGLPASVLLAKGGEILYYGFSLPPNLDQWLEPRSMQ